jgi:hypothetical protein
MRYIPNTVSQMSDHFAIMASAAPKYEQRYNPDGDPQGEFRRTQEGLENIRPQIGEGAYEYLLARVEENWGRLQSGKNEDLRELKLSFGEMAYFLMSKKYKDAHICDSLTSHTEVAFE